MFAALSVLHRICIKLFFNVFSVSDYNHGSHTLAKEVLLCCKSLNPIAFFQFLSKRYILGASQY
jgi:hypothetical protein